MRKASAGRDGETGVRATLGSTLLPQWSCFILSAPWFLTATSLSEHRTSSPALKPPSTTKGALKQNALEIGRKRGALHLDLLTPGSAL